MKQERTYLASQVKLLIALTIFGSAFRLLPYYWQEEHKGWLLFLWGANAILPLFVAGVSQCRNLLLGYLIPFLGFLLSDMVLQLVLESRNMTTASLASRLGVYALFLVLAQLGLALRWLKLKGLPMVLTGAGLTLLGSMLFFLISNFMVWMESTPGGLHQYAPTWAGLTECYVKAWPFFKNQFFGDALFSVVFLGSFALLHQRQYAASQQAEAALSA